MKQERCVELDMGSTPSRRNALIAMHIKAKTDKVRSVKQVRSGYIAIRPLHLCDVASELREVANVPLCFAETR